MTGDTEDGPVDDAPPDLPPALADLPELRPERWPDGATVESGDVPPFDPESQALRIRDWEERDGALRPEFFTLPRKTWAREAAYHDAARQVLETLSEQFEDGFKVWVVPPDPDDPDDDGEVVAGYLVDDGGPVAGPDPDLDAFREAVPETVDGTAARGTPHEYTVEGIPVVVERTLE